MTFKQFFFIPVYISLMAVSLVMLAKPSPIVIPYLWTWITFQAWAMYFMAGCTVKGGIKTMLGYLGGAAASIAIFELLGLFGGWGIPAAPSLAIAVFLVVIPVISAERVPWFDFIPAWFVGAGVFFGIMTLGGFSEITCKWTRYGEITGHLMVSCLIGQIYGVVTVAIRGKYEACLAARNPAPAEAPAESEAPNETPDDAE